MDRLLNRIKHGNRLKLALILVLAYFGQVYPHAHFHHSHGDYGLPISNSLHPFDANPDVIADHHEDEDHHHHTFDQTACRHMGRSYSRHVSLLSDLWCRPGGDMGIGPDAGPKSAARVYDEDLLPESVSADSFLCRGPPRLT